MRGMRPRTMATSSQRCRRGQIWQSLKILSGSSALSSTVRKSILEKEVGNARKQADRLDAVLFGFFDERAQNASACALALGFGLDDDGAHLAEMRPVKVQRAAAEKDAAIRLGDGEVANVLADFGEGALEQRAVAGERVDQVVDIGGVVQQGLTHQHEAASSHWFQSAAMRVRCAGKCLAHTVARGSADHVVAIERGVEA